MLITIDNQQDQIYNISNHVAPCTIRVAIMYSTLVVLNVSIGYFFDNHETTQFPSE